LKSDPPENTSSHSSTITSDTVPFIGDVIVSLLNSFADEV